MATGVIPAGDYTHMWRSLGHFSTNPMGISWTGIVFGLGFAISFGYWTTDFLVVQRVLAANDLRAARMAPVAFHRKPFLYAFTVLFIYQSLIANYST